MSIHLCQFFHFNLFVPLFSIQLIHSCPLSQVLRFNSFMSFFISIHSFQILSIHSFNSPMSIQSLQYLHFNSFVSIQSFQFIGLTNSFEVIHLNTSMSIPSFQFLHVKFFLSIHSFQFLHFKFFLSIESCQFFHFMHFISFQFTSFQPTKNSFKTCHFFETSALARAGRYLVEYWEIRGKHGKVM